MRVEVDQSGKIERTSRDTVVAFSNDEFYSVLIPAAVKQEIVAVLRERGRSRRPYLLPFSAALHELLKDRLDQLEQIVIDVEYEGREASIKLELVRLIRRERPDYPADRIQFARIGKKSLAHKQALATYRGELRPGKVLTLKRLMELLR